MLLYCAVCDSRPVRDGPWLRCPGEDCPAGGRRYAGERQWNHTQRLRTLVAERLHRQNRLTPAERYDNARAERRARMLFRSA